MASVLSMPRLSDTMAEGVLVKWLKKEGDPINPGDVVAEVETDKATMEMECYESGFLAKIVAPLGKGIPVGNAIAILTEEEGEDIRGELAKLGLGPAPAAPAPAAPAPVAAAPAPVAAAPAAAAPAAAAPVAVPASKGEGDDGRLKASPLARKIATDHQLELAQIAGSGPGGRIIKRDVEKALEEGVSRPQPVPVPVAQTMAMPAPVVVAPVASTYELPAGSELVPLSQMRKTIARRMVEAKQAAPHFYLTAEIEMGPALELRAQLNAAQSDVKISVNDLVVKACATALLKHPRVNASFAGDAVAQHSAVHMGVAVAIDDGLITPTLRDAHHKSVGQLAKETRELAERAQNKKLKPDEYTGATFTVSNLGMFGIVEFVAIINPPQAAILAVGAVREVPVVSNGQIVVGKRMRVTLSCDHRVIDGATGAAFLATLRDVLEHPLRLVV